MENYSENQFRAIIIRVVNFLRLTCKHTGISKVCNVQWRRHLNCMVFTHLKRTLCWILSCCAICEISRLHRLIFRENQLAVITAGEFIVQRNSQTIISLQALMADCNHLKYVQSLQTLAAIHGTMKMTTRWRESTTHSSAPATTTTDEKKGHVKIIRQHFIHTDSMHTDDDDDRQGAYSVNDSDESAVENKYTASVRGPGFRFTIVEERNHCVRRFRVNGVRIIMRVLQTASENFAPILWLELVIRDIHAYVVSMASDSDLIGVTMNSENLARGSGDDLWMLVSGVTQSNENFDVDDNFCIEAMYVEVPLGTGKSKSFGINALGQRSLICIVLAKHCDLVKICRTCLKRIHAYRGKQECGISYCKICHTKHSTNDACYMSAVRAPKRLIENLKKYLYVFYDFEIQQNCLFKNLTDMPSHVPN
ncbi:hypothetical protein TSAR_014642, partial [Trichomalopsis sarcophagae]